MVEVRWPIPWGGQLVGWIASPKVDMPHYYGRWVPADGRATIEFLEALRRTRDEDGGLDVMIADNLPGIVYTHPADDEVAIDVRWARLTR